MKLLITVLLQTYHHRTVAGTEHPRDILTKSGTIEISNYTEDQLSEKINEKVSKLRAEGVQSLIGTSSIYESKCVGTMSVSVIKIDD